MFLDTKYNNINCVEKNSHIINQSSSFWLTVTMTLSIKPVMHLVLVVSSYFADGWWEDKYICIHSVHDFANKHEWFLVSKIRIFPADIAIWGTISLLESSSKHEKSDSHLNWTVRWMFFLTLWLCVLLCLLTFSWCSLWPESFPVYSYFY